MEIIKKSEGEKLSISLVGNLDTTTTPDLEKELEDLSNVKELVFDFKDLAYVSSTGLRALLSAQKVMAKQGKMLIKNVIDEVMEVFEITGLVDVFTIE